MRHADEQTLIAPSPLGGRGLFARRALAAGEPIHVVRTAHLICGWPTQEDVLSPRAVGDVVRALRGTDAHGLTQELREEAAQTHVEYVGPIARRAGSPFGGAVPTLVPILLEGLRSLLWAPATVEPALHCVLRLLRGAYHEPLPFWSATGMGKTDGLSRRISE